MNNKTKIIAIMVVGILLGANSVFATRPTTAPQNNVVELLQTSATAQTKQGGLTLGYGVVDTALITPKLGVGVSAPAVAVEVAGTIAITDTTQGEGRFLTAIDDYGSAEWRSYGAGGGTIDLPSHSVVPFNLSECPGPDWVPYTDAAGRVIVGAGLAIGGTDSQTNIYASLKSRGDTGGEELHTLTLNESYHSHKLDSAEDDTEVDGGKGADSLDPDSEEKITNTVGGDPALGGLSRPHNEMQPYIVLTYCQKR